MERWVTKNILMSGLVFTQVHLIHPGAGIAPWNYSQYEFSEDAGVYM